MPETVASLEHEFRREMRGSAMGALRTSCVLGSLAFFVFGFVDPLLVPWPDFGLIFTRVALIAALMSILAASFTQGFEERVGVAGFAACFVIGGGVIACTQQVGGATTTYHEALLLTIFGFSVLPFTWTWKEAFASFTALGLAYDLTMALTGVTGSTAQWVTVNAVLWFMILISTAAVRLTAGLRRDEFDGRRQLAAANLRLQELDRAKTRFFTNLSHELRTPLTLSLAPLDALRECTTPVLTDMQRDNVELARRSALRLLKLVDDLLALSRLEAAALELKVVPVNLQEMAARLVAEVVPLAERKQIRVELRGGEGVPPVLGDVEQLERVFLNLLANALKFTPEGGSVSVAVLEDGGRVQVAIADSGIGIPADQLDRVFERFHQVDGSATRSFGGTGIGLSLVKELMELHQGTVRAESNLGHGTTMRCSFPPAAPGSLPTAALARHSAAEGLSEWHEQLRRGDEYRLMAVEVATERRLLMKRRPLSSRLQTILLIEDNPDMIRFIGGLLGADFNVLAATDGLTGLRMAHERRPDLVISDVMMPGLSGFDVLAQLRANPDLRGIPVMLLTALGDVESRVAGHGHGADAYLTKPFQVAELLAAIDGLLKNEGSRAELEGEREEERSQTLTRGVVAGLRASVEQLRGGTVDAGAEAVVRLERLLAELEILGGSIPEGGTVQTAVREEIDGVVAALPPEEARRVRVDHRTDRMVEVFPGDLARIITSLLANALYVTPRERAVLVTTRDEPEGGVRLEVKDGGPGVPSKHRARIFVPFYSTHPGSESSGLGLSLARGLARRCGGNLELLPDDGAGGATFSVRLP